MSGPMSLRARGLWLVIWGLAPGEPVSAYHLVTRCMEGRDVVRAALNELEQLGMLEGLRVRSGSRWVRSDSQAFAWPVRVDSQAAVRVDSQAVGSIVRLSTLNGVRVDSQATDPEIGLILRPSDQSLAGARTHTLPKGREVLEELEEASKSSSLAASENLDEPQRLEQDVPTEAVVVTEPSQIPWTEVHLLKTWFDVTGVEQVEAWRSAWATATATNGEGGFDVQAHLVGYLTRCREEKRDVRAGHWLRFLIEDRVRWVTARQHEAEVREQRDSADGGEQWVMGTFKDTPRWD